MSVNELETRGFQSEVKQLLHLMIHSLYSNKEVFLRELISNASDAADKLRFQALTEPEIYQGDAELSVRITLDKEKRTLTFTDNGIGMTHQEVVDNLGTIARSGTKAFLEQLGQDQSKNSQLIGQFGVGFYSSFIVADEVTVVTRSVTEPTDKAVFWQSKGEGDYSIAYTEKQNRGTEITLHLKPEEDEFLDDFNLKNIISKYSDHIALPVMMEKTDDKGDVTIETVNKAQALWTLNKNEISDEEYQNFYKNLSHDFNEPLIWSHNRVEGKQEYTSLLYIPANAPWDLWNREHRKGLKLYVQRVFIIDDAEQFIPNYLRFVKGILDSNDLPLNVSREILQDSRITQSIRQALTKRVLQMLEKLANQEAEKYQQFWQQFGLVLKEGMGEDHANKESIAALLRFATTKQESNVQEISLKTYIERMVEGQEKIYYITSDSYAAAKSSPHLELFRKKGIEVLLLSDRVDEWMMSYLTEFEGKSFASISQSDESLENLIDKDEKTAELEQSFTPFVERVKGYLESRVKDVKLTHRLVDSPAVVVSDGMSTQMAKLFAAMGQQAPEVQYILELNPEHPLINKITEVTDEALFQKWIDVLFDQALLIEQGNLNDPNSFIQRVNQLLLV